MVEEEEDVDVGPTLPGQALINKAKANMGGFLLPGEGDRCVLSVCVVGGPGCVCGGAFCRILSSLLRYAVLEGGVGREAGCECWAHTAWPGTHQQSQGQHGRVPAAR